MINKGLTLRPIAIIAFGIFASNAYAGLELATFNDTTGTTQSVTESDLDIVSIDSDLNLYISSGLDRKLTVSLLKNGTVIESKSTSVINISDRITVNSKDYYGKIVSFSAPTTDGTYQIVVNHLNLSGEVTSTNTYEFTQDTTPPTIGGDFEHVANAYTYSSMDLFGNTRAVKQINVTGVSDANGISKAQYWVKQPDNTKKYKDVTYNASTNKVVIDGSIAASTGSGLVPSPYYGYFQIGVDVYDEAGNKSTINRYSHIDLTCPSTNFLVQVLNAKTNKWETYKSGMNIYANPVTVRYGRLLSDFATTSSPYGWMMNANITNSDSKYAYYQRTFPYKQQSTYFRFFSQAGTYCNSTYLSTLSFTLAGSDLDYAPRHTGIAYKTTLSDDWVSSATFKTNKTAKITKVRLFSEKRKYRQKRTINGGGTCYVEVGDTYCDINTSYNYSSNRGYSPYAHYAYKADGTLGLHTGYLYTYWDFNSPEISNLEFNEEAKTVLMATYDSDTVTDWRSGMWVISGVGASAFVNGKETTLNQLSSTKIDFQNREYVFDVSKLNVEAIVPITFWVKDSYGNKTEKTQSYTIDSVKPVISITYDSSDVPAIISDIRDFEINVSDFSSAALTSAQLTGSDSNENVYLAIVDDGDGNYSVEKPKIFPTLSYDSGERYTLNLVAKDSYGNTQTKSIKFGYTPDNLITVDTQQYLPSGSALYDGDDKSIATIYSDEVLTLESSQVATGEQEAEITNRSGSDFAIVVKGNNGLVTVEPGETKSMVVDLGSAGAKLSIEVYPAEKKEGSAQFMFNIPSLTTIYQ